MLKRILARPAGDRQFAKVSGVTLNFKPADPIHTNRSFTATKRIGNIKIAIFSRTLVSHFFEFRPRRSCRSCIHSGAVMQTMAKRVPNTMARI